MLFQDWPRDRLLQLTTDFNGDDSVVLIGGDNEVRRFGSEAAMIRAIEDFAPDAIYVRPEPLSVQHFDLVLRALGELPQPAALHIMDDWVSGDFIPTHDGVEALERVARRIARRAVLRFTDGPAYIADFSVRLGAKFGNLLNGVDLEAWDQPLPARAPDAPFTLTHMGNYDSEMSRQAVLDIAEAVDRLGARSSIRFDVHVRDYVVATARADLSAYPSTRVLEQVSSFDAYVETLRRSDVNVYAYNQDPISVRYMGKGIPNKTCELLAARRPILAYGPTAFAGIQYLRDHDAALTASSRSELAEAIRRLHDTPSLGSRTVAHGVRLVQENHDAAKLRLHFADQIGEIAAAGPGAAGDASDASDRDWYTIARPQIISHRLNQRRAPSFYAVDAKARALRFRLVDLHEKLTALNSTMRGTGTGMTVRNTQLS
jgi:hypothetical protein